MPPPVIHYPDGGTAPGDAGSCPDGSRAATCHGVKRGGCCNVAGTTPVGPASLLALLGLALVFAARRRKR
jgi:MYXO-CTERM domain-containing protein